MNHLKLIQVFISIYFFNLINIKELDYNFSIMKKQQTSQEVFLLKYTKDLSGKVSAQPQENIKAKILAEEEVDQAASCIQNGKLVAFPTQTVYGLGANALNPQALKQIYETKRRPLTDPIIVHVNSLAEANKLVITNPQQQQIFELLAKKFWPGPLTVILKANLQILPLIVTAQTGFVGIRSPKHPFARKLIEKSGLPIGAPSANLFSHVSPTEPVHVFNDFWDCPISIVDGQRCEFGVQSTVIKLLNGELHVFREGSLSIKKLQSYLQQQLQENKPRVIVHKRVEKEQINMQSPGQLLKHYAPNLPCYFIDRVTQTYKYSNQDKSLSYNLKQTAFISFHTQYEPLKDQCAYFFRVGQNLPESAPEQQQEIFCSKEQKLQMREVYYLLRKCQNLPVEALLIGWGGFKQGAVWDKIFRSTQGNTLYPTQ